MVLSEELCTGGLFITLQLVVCLGLALTFHALT